jgi:hypothetical protein
MACRAKAIAHAMARESQIMPRDETGAPIDLAASVERTRRGVQNRVGQIGNVINHNEMDNGAGACQLGSRVIPEVKRDLHRGVCIRVGVLLIDCMQDLENNGI